MSRRTPWLIPVLLLLQTLFTGMTFGTSVIAFALFGLVALGVILCRRNDVVDSGLAETFRARRTFFVTLMVAFVFVAVCGWRLADHLGDSINPLEFGIDAFAHFALCQSLVLALLYPKTGHPGMLGLGLLVVMLCVAAGGASQSLTGQVSVAMLTLLGFLFASRQILHEWTMRHREGLPDTVRMAYQKPSADVGRTGLIFMALALSVILMATSGVAHVTSLFLPDIQGLVHAKLQESLDAVTETRTMVGSKYVRGSRLGSVRRHMLNDSNEIALKAFSEVQPGYLRGTAFDVYSGGRWLTIENQDLQPQSRTPALESVTKDSIGPGETRIEGRSRRPLKRFRLHEFDSRLASVEIHNVPLKGQVYFAPLNSRWIEANSNGVRVSPNGILEYGIDAGSPYVLGVSEKKAPEELDAKRRRVLTFVEPALNVQVKSIASEICEKLVSPRDKANAIQNYFQAGFEYSLERVPALNQGDPIVEFLRTKHPANCEYFASATAIMLRSQDVPARYVTGYVASEFSQDKESWVARNRDAHAWVEAFDQSTGVWFPVESTPGRVYQSISGEGLESAQDQQGQGAENRGNSADESLFSQVIGWLLSFRATDPLMLAFRIVQVPLFLVAAFFLWKKFLRGGGEEGNPDDIKSLQMLRRVDRKLRKHELVRAPHETMHQFADRVEQHGRDLGSDRPESQKHIDDTLNLYAKWYRSFAAARYQGRLPEPLVV